MFTIQHHVKQSQNSHFLDPNNRGIVKCSLMDRGSRKSANTMKQSTRWTTTTGLRSAAAEEVKKWLRKSKRRSGGKDITIFPEAATSKGGARWRGALCVLGGFLIQLALGSYYRLEWGRQTILNIPSVAFPFPYTLMHHG